MTRFQLHLRDWKDCKRCSLCKTRTQVVLARGSVPCEILFIGEAPGFSEDALGRPFVGPAGQLLDDIIRHASPHCLEQREVNGMLIPTYIPERRIAFTNLVCCIPKGKDGSKTAEPDHDDIMACQSRLYEFVSLCQPRMIVTVGKLAEEYVGGPYKSALRVPAGIKVVRIMHPAAILRTVTANQSLLRQKCIVQITKALQSLDEVESVQGPNSSDGAAFTGHEYDGLSDDPIPF